MKREKVLSVILTGALTVMMSACAQSSSDSFDTNPDSPAEKALQGENSENRIGSDGYEAQDMGGRTIKIGLWWDEYWDSDYRSLDDITAAGGSYDSAENMQMKLDAVRAVEKKWNCRIDWVNLGWDGIIDSINTTVPSGTPECDIYLTDLQFGIAPVASGYAQKLSEICPKGDVNNSQMIFTKNRYLGLDDYFFSNSCTVSSGAMYMVYNAQMLDDAGLTYPEELAQRGEWTWDKFNEYAKALTKDTDGDGQMDVYGFGSGYTLAIQGFAASNNAVIAGNEKQGLADKASEEVFEELRQLYVTDGTARPVNNDDWNDNILAFSTGKAAFGFAQPWMLTQEKGNHDFDVRICPAPSGPNGDDSMSPAQIVNNYFIPKGVEDPTAVYEIFEELSNWYDGDTQIRDDSEWFASAFTDDAQVALATEIGNKSNDDIWTLIDAKGAVGAVFYSACISKDRTVPEAIEANKDTLQEELDAYVNAS